MKRLKENGITLIALVVTIVVLLILAGVSIAMLAGEDGIIRQAQNAKENTKKAEIEEKVRLAVNASRIDGRGNIDTTELQKELEKLGWDGDVTAGFPATGTINGMKVEIKANGDVTVTEGTLADDDELKPMVLKLDVEEGSTVDIRIYRPELSIPFLDDTGEYNNEIIELPDNTDVTIDWGDGNVVHYTSSNFEYDEVISHIYNQANDDITLRIMGKCNVLELFDDFSGESLQREAG